MTRIFATLSALFLALPVWAAGLSDRYEAIGTMTATLDGAATDMVITYDREKDRAFAEQKMIMGSFLTINTVGQVVGDDGEPGRPILQITLQRQAGKMALLSAEIFDEQGYDAPMVMGPDGGEGTLTAFEMGDDNTVTATIEGTFLRLTGYMDEPRVADDAQPVPARVDWPVTLPPME